RRRSGSAPPSGRAFRAGCYRAFLIVPAVNGADDILLCRTAGEGGRGDSRGRVRVSSHARPLTHQARRPWFPLSRAAGAASGALLGDFAYAHRRAGSGGGNG